MSGGSEYASATKPWIIPLGLAGSSHETKTDIEVFECKTAVTLRGADGAKKIIYKKAQVRKLTTYHPHLCAQ